MENKRYLKNVSSHFLLYNYEQFFLLLPSGVVKKCNVGFFTGFCVSIFFSECVMMNYALPQNLVLSYLCYGLNV